MVGDLMIVQSGIHIPGDCILLEGSDLQTTESEMTGESDNLKKQTLEECVAIEAKLRPNVDMTQIKSKDYSKLTEDHRHDVPSPCLISGTQVAEGRGKVVVCAVGAYSCEGRLKDITQLDDDLTPLQKKLNNVANDISKAGLFAAVTAVVILYVRFGVELGVGKISWSDSESPSIIVEYFVIGITVLVVAIPEGLPLAVTISLAYSVLKMQKENNLVRRLHACETMGGVDSICSDKTGTLTTNKMDLAKMWFDKKVLDYEYNKDYNSTSFNAEYFALLKEAICLNSVADITTKIEEEKEKVEEHGSKTEVALLKFLSEMGHNDWNALRADVENRGNIRRFFFSSTRKRSSFVLPYGPDNQNKRVHVKGAAEVVLDRSTKYLTMDATEQSLTEEDKRELLGVIENFNSHGLRTILLAYRNLEPGFDVESIDDKEEPMVENGNLCIISIVGIQDPLKEGVPEAVQKCKQAHIKVRMVTGDNVITAKAIARNCGILEGDGNERIMEGVFFAEQIGGMIKVCKTCKLSPCCCSEAVKAKRAAKMEKKRLKKEAEQAKEAQNATITPDSPVVVEEDEDDNMEDGVADLEKFAALVDDLDILARSRPQDKYILVTGLKQLGHIVAVTGDGSNDAPALSKADIGFAMGLEGTDLAKESAGIILLDDNFASIVVAIKWGRNIYDNIRRFIVFQLTVNVVACSAAIVGAVTIKQSPLTAVQMLWVNLIMDTLASLALATEPPTEDLLNRKPQSKTEYIVSKLMWKHIFGQGFLQIVLIFTIMYAGEWFLPEYGDKSNENIMVNPENEDMVRSGRLYRIDGSEDYYEYQKDPDIGASRHFTYIFNIFVMLQLFNEFNARKIKDECNTFEGLGRAWMFIVIWIAEFLLQVVMVFIGGTALKVHYDGLTAGQFFISLAFGLIVIPWRFLLILIPIEKAMPETGNEERDIVEEGAGFLGVRGMGSRGMAKRQSSNIMPA